MYNSIFIDEFTQKEKKEPLNVLDVREVDEFVAGHIKNAENFPLSSLQNTYNKLDKKKDYYVICHSGSRSQMASQFLAAQGFNVTNVMGGMSSFKGEIVS